MLASTRKEVGFWQYVKQSDQDCCEIDRDRAMEYVRKHTPDAKTFKLFLLGASIAFDQARSRSKEVLGFYADFYLDTKRSEYSQTLKAVTIKVEIRSEEKNPRAKDRSMFYEFTLLVDSDGTIVDVDYRKLIVRLHNALHPMRY